MFISVLQIKRCFMQNYQLLTMSQIAYPVYIDLMKAF